MKEVAVNFSEQNINKPNFQDNVKIVRDSKPENGIRKYRVVDVNDNEVIVERLVHESEDISKTIATDYCEWIRGGGSKIIEHFFINKDAREEN